MATLKAAILQCDDVLEKFQATHGNYPDMVKESFQEVSEKLEFDVYDVRKLNYPSDPSVYSFYVITGSKSSVYDDDYWIASLVKYIRMLDRVDLPVFGICFGHQIMALAMGCEVKKSEKGWGVGIASTRLTEFGKSLGFTNQMQNMIVSHQDQVINIPHKSMIISGNDFCPFFAVKWSRSLMSIQGHPEWTKTYSQALMLDRKDRIPAEVIDEGIRSLSKELDNQAYLKIVLQTLGI